jgi:hypothetical protein
MYNSLDIFFLIDLLYIYYTHLALLFYDAIQG